MTYLSTEPYLLIFFIIGYISGSVPYGFLLGKLLGKVDIRESGSGNIGATNALRVGGKKLGILTLLCDFLKAFLPVLIVKIYCNTDYAILTALGAFFGHLFPIWLKFKGGKGVACGVAVAMALSFKLGIFVCAMWLSTAFITKYSSLSALIAFALLPLAAYLITFNTQIVMVITVISLIILIKHKANILRLIKGEESKINLSKKS